VPSPGRVACGLLGLGRSPGESPDGGTLYRERLAGDGRPASMSRRGNCWDNAVVESFVHTLKTELVDHRRDITREEARQDIFAWIDVFSNRTRRHSTLGYRSPAEFEAMAMGASPGVHEIGGRSVRDEVMLGESMMHLVPCESSVRVFYSRFHSRFAPGFTPDSRSNSISLNNSVGSRKR
jgi:hypothetical protein